MATNKATTASADVIDLCDGEDNSPAAEYAKSMTASLSKRKRLPNSRTSTAPSRKKSPPASTADAIEIDLGNHQMSAAAASTKDPTAVYRGKLGPVRFEFVDSFVGQHAFVKQKQNPSLKTHKLYKELLEYQLNLPIELSSSIFVRVCESRLDLIRAMITGPEGTPYANGCFLFDIHVGDYPRSAPSVKFLTTGQGRVRFNPNLYNCGKVCLSLLGTWAGPGWQANKSTLLQVLVSIQGLIFVPDPYYNEPGFEKRRGEPRMEKLSKDYNKSIRRHTLQHGMDDFLTKAVNGDQRLRDYPEFAAIMIGHFCERHGNIETQLDDWMKGDKQIHVVAARVRQNLRMLVAVHQPTVPKAPLVVPMGPPEIVTIDQPPSLSSRKAPPVAAATKAQPEIVIIE